MPSFVNVQIRQALIGPTKVGGAPWDGPGVLDQNSIDAIAGLMTHALEASNPSAAVISAFANPIIAALDKPDPQGVAKAVAPDGMTVLASVELPKWQDSLTPMWSNAFLQRVPLNPNARIEITLIDKDINDDDAIGAATIQYNDLVAAFRGGNVYHVPIAGQTNRQALFVDVSVYPAQ